MGPILVHARAASGRRWQTFALRSVCVSMLLVGVFVIWVAHAAGRPQAPIRGQSEVGAWYYSVMVGVQLALALLAAPAYTAGSVCEDRTRGVLTHLLVTDLSAAEIVLEKLAAGLGSILGLLGCAVPVAYMVAWLGGIEPRALVWAFAVAASVAVLSGALAFALSIWARSTHEALLGVYASWALVLLIYPAWRAIYTAGNLGPPPPSWTWRINPFWLSFAYSLDPSGVTQGDFPPFLAATLGASALLVVLAIARLRAVTVAKASASTSSSSLVSGRGRVQVRVRLSRLGRLLRALPGPSLDGNPVLWREWHRRIASARGRVLWGAFVASYAIVACLCLSGILREGVGPGPDPTGALTALLLLAGLLMASASATTSLAEERLRGSLDVLLATPLHTWEILSGKWWGTFRVFPYLAVWPSVLIAALAFGWRRPYPFPIGGGQTTFPSPSSAAAISAIVLMAAFVLAHGAMIASLGLALATWTPRPGRASALCVTYYVLVCVGWPALTFAVLPNTWPAHSARCVATLSPFFGFVELADYASCPAEGSTSFLPWITLWTLVLGAGASGLLAATRLVFDRRLGRATPRDVDRGRDAGARRRPEPRAAVAWTGESC